MKDTARTTGVEGRIVNLSSVAHIHTYKDGIQFNNINDKKRCVAFSTSDVDLFFP
jgi:hypothetical protein